MALLRPHSASAGRRFSTPLMLPLSRTRNSLLKARMCTYPNADLSVWPVILGLRAVSLWSVNSPLTSPALCPPGLVSFCLGQVAAAGALGCRLPGVAGPQEEEVGGGLWRRQLLGTWLLDTDFPFC